MARPKKSPKPPTHRRAKRKRPSSALRTEAQYHALSDKSKDALERALRVVSKLRNEKTSLTKASREVGINPETVKRRAGTALKKSDGRFKAKSSDRLLRILKIPTERGVGEIAVRGSRQATLLAEYWNALHRYLETGRSTELEKFQSKFIKNADGNEIPLPTDRAQLRTLGRAGVLSFENLYSHSA